MNYQRIYNEIIDRAIGRELETYTEAHHITPKCMGGSDDTDNIVHLTYREHFIVHWLLHRIHPNNKKLAYAFSAMKMDKYGNRFSEWTPSSRQLEESKIAYIEARQGSVHSEETKLKMSESLTGRLGWNKGKTMSDESRKKMSESKMGWDRPDEDKKKISEGKKNWFKKNVHPNTGKNWKIENEWDRSKEGREQRIKKVKELYTAGVPISKIPNEVTVSRASIYTWIKEYGWER